MLTSNAVLGEGPMRGFVVSRHAHPGELQMSYNLKEPQATEGEVLVDVYSAGLNFADILQSQGQYQVRPPLPFILGSEFSGRISPTSPIPPHSPFRPGDRVFGFSQGAFADKVNVDVRRLYKLPDQLTFKEGAGLYVTWFTAYMALVDRGRVKPGECVLVTAAAGALGLACVQLAKSIGATVIAAAGSSPAKRNVSQWLGGADFIVDYSDPEWINEVQQITGGKGVDVAVDVVGATKDLLKCVAWKARLLVVGFAAGSIPKIPMNLVLLKNISLVGVYVSTRNDEYLPCFDATWSYLCPLFESGKIRPITYPHAYSLEEVGPALRAIERRETWGKVVITVRAEHTLLGRERAKL